jgi:hypothetical protein
MDSDDECGIDSGNVSSDEDYDFMQTDEIQRTGREDQPVEYPYEVLTTEEIVQHMLDCIAEVNNVVEVSNCPNLTPKSEIGSNLLLLRQLTFACALL